MTVALPNRSSSLADSEVLAFADGGSGSMGKGQFLDTFINSLNILLGVSVLTMPYAFAKGGWVVVPLIVVCCIAACYTAYLLSVVQRDVVSVKAPRSLPPMASGVYSRVPSLETGVRRFQKRIQVVPNPAQVQEHTKLLAAEKNEPHGDCKEGVFTVTWLGREEGRWVVDYSGPNLPAPQQADCEDVQEFLAQPEVQRLEQYPDIGRAAFGNIGYCVVQGLFVVELFIYVVSLVVLVVTNITFIADEWTNAEVTAAYLGFLIPLSLVQDFGRLSFVSYFGLLAAAVILAAVLYFGLSTPRSLPEGSGSFVTYSRDTSLFVPETFSYSFALVMGCFAGHSLFLSFRGAMSHPGKHFMPVVNISFFIGAVYCLGVGVLGYLMYGQANLKDVLNHNFDKDNWVSTAVAVCIVVVTASKHGLASNVLCQSVEQAIVENTAVRPGWSLYAPVRVLVTLATAAVAIFVPNFGQVRGLLGAGLACTVSLIFPVVTYVYLLWCNLSVVSVLFHTVFILISVYFAITGTINCLDVPL